jgi:hypothetical protein
LNPGHGAPRRQYNETEKMWRATNGARLRFAYLERDANADQYQGHSYTRLYVEEIGTFPSPAPVFKLMATLRSSAGVPVGLNPWPARPSMGQGALYRPVAAGQPDHPRRADRPQASFHPVQGRKPASSAYKPSTSMWRLLSTNRGSTPRPQGRGRADVALGGGCFVSLTTTRDWPSTLRCGR